MLHMLYNHDLMFPELAPSSALELEMEEDVISPNSTKSSPDLGLPRSISDLLDYSVHPQSPNLGPISDYLDYP